VKVKSRQNIWIPAAVIRVALPMGFHDLGNRSLHSLKRREPVGLTLTGHIPWWSIQVTVRSVPEISQIRYPASTGAARSASMLLFPTRSLESGPSSLGSVPSSLV